VYFNNVPRIGTPKNKETIVNELKLKEIFVKFFNTTQVFQQWLDENEKYAAPNKHMFPRIVCNYYQPGITELSCETFCLCLKNPRNKWKWVPLLVFCENYIGLITIQQSVKNGIWITCNEENVIVYASSPKIPIQKFSN